MADQFSGVQSFFGNNSQVASNITASGNPIKPIELFFKSLQGWVAGIPTQSLWMVFIDIPPVVTDETMKYWGESINNNNWGVNNAITTTSKPEYQELIGCVFASGVGIPGERHDITSVGVENRGWQKVPVSEKRNQFEVLRVDFRETNVSFVDSIIRPWLIISSHYGMIARPSNQSVKSNITIFNLGKAGVESDQNGNNSRPLEIRKIWYFQDCVPTSTGPSDYTTGADSGPENKTVNFVYSKYQVYLPEQYVSDMQKIDGNPVKHQYEVKSTGKNNTGVPTP